MLSTLLCFIRQAAEKAMTTTAQEMATQERVAADALEVIPTGAALGATVNGVNLRDLSEATFARILQAWHAHSVLSFRGQTLTDQELIAFSRRLGDLDWAPVQETGRRFVEGLPEIYIVSNVKVNGEPIGSLGDGEHALRARNSSDRRQHILLHHVRHLRGAAAAAQGPHRRAQDQARRHLQ